MGAFLRGYFRSVSEKWLFTRTNRNMQPRSIAQLQHIVCKILSPTHCPSPYLLKAHNVYLHYPIAELENDLASLKQFEETLTK